MTESELEDPNQSAQVVREDDEDRFLKELEHENRMLEEELKCLQKSNSRKSGIIAVQPSNDLS